MLIVAFFHGVQYSPLTHISRLYTEQDRSIPMSILFRAFDIESPTMRICLMIELKLFPWTNQTLILWEICTRNLLRSLSCVSSTSLRPISSVHRRSVKQY